MGTRQGQRPVFLAVASRPPALYLGRSGTRSAGPCARDPPRYDRVSYQPLPARPTAGGPRRTRQEDPALRPQKGRGDAPTSPLPNAGLAKLVLVTASYVTWRFSRCLPPAPAYLEGLGRWDRRRGSPRSLAIRHARPRRSRLENRMPVPTSNPQDTQAVIAVVIAIAACLGAVYWRTALRVILIAAIALAVYGTVVGIDGVTSLISAHHR